MVRKVMQARYYKDENLRYQWPKENNLFNEKNIVVLGIQAPVNTQFNINNESNSITIGQTGMYEIDVSGFGYITSLQFTNLETIINTDNEFIFVDIVYEEPEGGVK